MQDNMKSIANTEKVVETCKKIDDQKFTKVSDAEMEIWREDNKKKIEQELYKNITDGYRNISGIPKKYWIPGEWKHYHQQEKMVEVAKEYVDDIKNKVKSGKSLMFIGPRGTGKTRVISGIGLAAIKNQIKTLYLDDYDFNMNCKTKPFLTFEDQRHFAWQVERYREVEFFIYDDIGAETYSEHNIVFVADLINYRYKNNLATIFSTMYNGDSLSKRLNGRDQLVGRISEMAAGFTVNIEEMESLRGV